MLLSRWLLKLLMRRLVVFFKMIKGFYGVLSHKRCDSSWSTDISWPPVRCMWVNLESSPFSRHDIFRSLALEVLFIDVHAICHFLQRLKEVIILCILKICKRLFKQRFHFLIFHLWFSKRLFLFNIWDQNTFWCMSPQVQYLIFCLNSLYLY